MNTFWPSWAFDQICPQLRLQPVDSTPWVHLFHSPFGASIRPLKYILNVFWERGFWPSKLEEVLITLTIVGHFGEDQRKNGHQEDGEHDQKDALVAAWFAHNDGLWGQWGPGHFWAKGQRDASFGGGIAGWGRCYKNGLINYTKILFSLKTDRTFSRPPPVAAFAPIQQWTLSLLGFFYLGIFLQKIENLMNFFYVTRSCFFG